MHHQLTSPEDRFLGLYVWHPGRPNIFKETNDLGLLDTIPTADLVFVKPPGFQFGFLYGPHLLGSAWC